MIQSLIKSDDYVKGSSYLNSVSQIGTLVGLAVAGVLISVFGIWGAILIDAFTFIFSAIIIYSIKFIDLRKESLQIQTIKGVIKQIIEGFQYLKSKKILFIVVLLTAFMNFSFVPYNVLRPVYVSEVMQLGVEGLSYLGMAIFFGMIVGGLVMGKIGKDLNPINAISFGLIMMGVMYMLLGIVEFFFLPYTIQIIYSIVITFFLGFFVPIMQAPTNAIVMKTTSPEMIGRLSSIRGAFVLCAMPLGGALVSFIGDSITVTLLYTIMGVFGICISSMFWVKHRKATFT